MALPTAAASGSNAVYWVGQDGNVYLKAAGVPGGVVKEGAAIDPAITGTGYAATGANGKEVSGKATEIADPNPGNPAPVAPADPNDDASGSSGGSTAAPVDKSNDIALQLAGLGAIAGQTSSGDSAIDKEVASLFGEYDTDKTNAQTQYQTQSDANQNQLQQNKQTALVNAAQGRQGLLGTLASIGALSGSGITEANTAVQDGANVDLTGAANNYGTNQSGLDTSIAAFNADDTKRRTDATNDANNDKENVQNQSDQDQQNFDTNIANDYAAEGDTPDAAKYSNLAASLYPQIAATDVPTSSLTAETAAFTPASLNSYISNGNTVVQTSPAPGATGGAALPGLSANTLTVKKQTNPLATVA